MTYERVLVNERSYSLRTENISVVISDEDFMSPKSIQIRTLEMQREKKKQILIEKGLYIS